METNLNFLSHSEQGNGVLVLPTIRSSPSLEASRDVNFSSALPEDMIGTQKIMLHCLPIYT